MKGTCFALKTAFCLDSFFFLIMRNQMDWLLHEQKFTYKYYIN